MKRAPEASELAPVSGQKYKCKVCSQPFSSQNSLTCHLRDKQDDEHKQFRSDPASCETAQKRPRTRSAPGGGCGETGGKCSDEANEDNNRCSGTVDAPADDGIARKLAQGANSLAQGAFNALTTIQQRVFAPSMPSHNDVGSQERSPTPAMPPSAPGGAVQAEMPSQERAEHKALSQENRGLREKCDEQLTQLTQLKTLSRRLETENKEGSSNNRHIKTENENLRKQLEKMRQENSALRQTMDEWRAERAAAAAGNDNINSNFPFKQDIVKSYGTLTNASGILWALLDPCIDVEDIPLACGVCKMIFKTCSGFARTMVEEPKDRFKEMVMAGEGGEDVQEWEDARVHMTKVQRATRERLVSQEVGRVKDLVDLWLQDPGAHGHFQVGVGGNRGGGGRGRGERGRGRGAHGRGGMVCRYWQQNGTCRDGDNCRFAHDEQGTGRQEDDRSAKRGKVEHNPAKAFKEQQHKLLEMELALFQEADVSGDK